MKTLCTQRAKGSVELLSNLFSIGNSNEHVCSAERIETMMCSRTMQVGTVEQQMTQLHNRTVEAHPRYYSQAL